MIELTCTNCKAVLHIDDGFAGGVCRCQHCGTIQTVPSQLKGNAGNAPAPKALFKQKVVAGGQRGTGLDQLADVVSGSGLVGTGLTSGRLRQGVKGSNRLLLIGGIIGGAVVAAIVVIVLMSRGGGTPGPAPGGGAQTGEGGVENTSPTVTISGPSFITAKLSGPKVIYIVDRGNASKSAFESMIHAAAKSVGSLGRKTQYQVIFWQNRAEVGPEAYPTSGTTSGGDANDALKGMLAINPYGATKLAPAMKKAVALKPDEIVIATGRYDIDKSDVDAAIAAAKKGSARIYTFGFPGCGDPDSFKRIAEAGKGEFHMVTPDELALWGQ